MSDPVHLPSDQLTDAERILPARAYELFGKLESVAGAMVPVDPAFPIAAPINRIVGEQRGWPETEEQLDEALDAIPEGVSFYVARDGSDQEAKSAWFERRGLKPASAWMAFRRTPEKIDPPPTELRVAVAESDADFESFAEITTTAFGIPGGDSSALTKARQLGWQVWLAWDGERPVGAAGTFTHGRIGYLGGAGTLPEARGRGAQTALLAARITAAFESGLEGLIVETGERMPDRPDDSYRNILRAGFTEVTLTENLVGRR